MKKILTILFFLICLLPLFAATSFYTPSEAQFLIDLGSTTYYSHESAIGSSYGSSSNYTKWAGKTTPTSTKNAYYYYDDQMIGTYGVLKISSSVTFTITNSDDWYYTDSEGNKRPYGIDLILKTDHDDYYNYSSNGPVIHMGRQDSSAASTGTTVSSGTAITITDSSMSSAWADICLVLPDFNDASVQASKNSFTGRITITIASGTLTDTQVIDLSGNFPSASGSTSADLNAVVNIVPTDAATNLDIKSLKENSSVVAVAKYLFTTEFKNKSSINYSGNKAYLFLSSNKDGSSKGETFTLRHIINSSGATSSTDNAYNSVTFVAYLSESETETFNSSNAREFDGTTSYSSSNTSSYLQAESRTVTNNASVSNIRWISEGYIFVKITGDTSTLTSGDYTSTIYIHVVSPD